MLKMARKLLLLMLALLSRGACAAETRWQEEIVTAEGARIVLNRSESRDFFASNSLPGSGVPRKQTLSASIPGLGEVAWEYDDYMMARPLAFDFIAGTPWLVLDNDLPCEKLPTDEPLRVFRYSARKWTQVRMSDAPPQLEANLLTHPYAESHGNLGRRPFLGKCDVGPKDESYFRVPASKWLWRPPYCGKKRDEMARAVLRGGRNCALQYPPRHPSFETQWPAYQQAVPREVTARTVNAAVAAPGRPPAVAGKHHDNLSPGPMRFGCMRGCTADVLDQVIEYRLNDRSGPLEFALAGPGDRRFYARLIASPSTLVCDRQGFKMLHMDRDASGTRRIRAEVFDAQGKLAGKWNVAVPDLQAEPAYVYAFEMRESELRVLIGHGSQFDLCRAAEPESVIELRAPH